MFPLWMFKINQTVSSVKVNIKFPKQKYIRETNPIYKSKQNRR